MLRMIILFVCCILPFNVFADTQPQTVSKNPLKRETQNVNHGRAQSSQQAGELFMSENKTKPGVVTLPSGLQYKIIIAGTGKSPLLTDIVTVDYQGEFVNGKIFDSSYQRGEPVSFPVNGVIPGWTQALQLMKQGATWMLYVPPQLAYGEKGAPGAIGPNETLIFKVHLISIR